MWCVICDVQRKKNCSIFRFAFQFLPARNKTMQKENTMNRRRSIISLFLFRFFYSEREKKIQFSYFSVYKIFGSWCNRKRKISRIQYLQNFHYFSVYYRYTPPDGKKINFLLEANMCCISVISCLDDRIFGKKKKRKTFVRNICGWTKQIKPKSRFYPMLWPNNTQSEIRHSDSDWMCDVLF